MATMNLSARIKRATTAINEQRCKTLNASASGDFYVVEVIGSSDTYVATVTPGGATCSCIYGRNTPWGWSNPCYHALAAAGHVDLDVAITPPITKEEEGNNEDL